MFANLLSRLTASEPETLHDDDSRLALGALLVRLAKSDGEYSVEEILRIDRILAARHGLNPVDAAKMRASCEDLETQAPDTYRFTRGIKDTVPYEDRTAVVEALWDVVLADGFRDDEEDALLRTVAPMLGVSDQDSALARQRIEAKRI